MSRKQYSPAQAAAVTAIPGVVFSGGVSGYLRAYATRDGSLLWEVDTAQDYITVNGVKAKGGAMEGPGPTVVGRDALCKLGLRIVGRHIGQRTAGLLGRREVIVDSQLFVGLNVKKFRMVVNETDFDAGDSTACEQHRALA